MAAGTAALGFVCLVCHARARLHAHFHREPQVALERLAANLERGDWTAIEAHALPSGSSTLRAALQNREPTPWLHNRLRTGSVHRFDRAPFLIQYDIDGPKGPPTSLVFQWAKGEWRLWIVNG